MKEKKLINLKQASELSGKSCQQLRRLINSGKLKASKKGRSWMINQSDLDFDEGGYSEKKEIDSVVSLDEPKNPLDISDVEEKSFVKLGVLPVQLSLASIVAVLVLLSLAFSLLLSSGPSIKASFSKVKQEKHIPTEQEKNISHSIFGD
ncbi:MAG: Helix-turn-helix domain protein [Parcubacteria group bacterium ADurb.Bin326]|nr:MAG: Helix-turn-helix domain protein [Parcubacteria group bacterium ADurb.Bin326]